MPAATPLVGRTAELGSLEAALRSATDGAPSAVEVVGPAGIGKSRLLAELTARADALSFVALTGAGAEFEQDLPFWVFVDALDEYVAGLDPRRLERLDAAVRAELSQVLPSLADAGGAPAPALHERYRTHRAMRALLEQLAATKPLLLVLDDFHWADPASTDLLVALLHRPPVAGVLLTLAARPRQLPTRLATALDRASRDGLLTRLELDPLTREEARQLVGAGTDELYEETGGNPFYLEQLARAPAASAGARRPDLSVAGVAIPPAVVAALSEELALLTPAARQALEGASVAGDPFEIDLAAAAADLPETDMLQALDELARLDFVGATDMPRRFRFRHPIVRRAVYESAPGGWRIGAHERAANALAARGAGVTARAHHVERAGRQGDEQAVAVLTEAGAESALRAPATAARWYAAALRLLPETAARLDRVELLLPMAQALSASGQFEASHAALLESLEIVPADAIALRTQLATTCGRVEHLLGQHERAHDRLVQALVELPEEISPEGVSLMIELTADRVHRMNYTEMREWGSRAAAAAAELDDLPLRAAALGVRARGESVRGATPEAEAAHAEAAAAVDALSDTEAARRLDAVMFVAGAELYLHRFAEARAHAQRVLEVGRATGRGHELPVVFAILGMTAFFQGELRETIDPLEGAIETARLTKNDQALAWSLYARSRVALAVGEVDRALSMAQEAFDVAYDGRPTHRASMPAMVLGEAHLHLGKPDRAVELLERASGGPDASLAEGSFRSYFLEALVRAQLGQGDREAAERAAAVAHASAEAVRLPLAAAWADRAEAAVALGGGDADRAATLALDSALRANEAGAPLEAAQARILAGRALAQDDRREAALEVLRDAAAEMERRGALRYRDAAERELRQLGERIHRRSQPMAAEGTGVGALTKREREIAQRIVDRQTNRQIAEQLFLSPKTVETHIRNIFAKLGADSRVEVARIVEQSERVAASAS